MMGLFVRRGGGIRMLRLRGDYKARRDSVEFW
jgi:hypothetical protein